MTFVLTLGRPERFPHSRDVARFLSLRPKQRQSGARDPQLEISKSGDPYLRKLLVQCAHPCSGTLGKDSALRRWGLAKTEGVLLHRLWVSGEFYKPFPEMGECYLLAAVLWQPAFSGDCDSALNLRARDSEAAPDFDPEFNVHRAWRHRLIRMRMEAWVEVEEDYR